MRFLSSFLLVCFFFLSLSLALSSPSHFVSGAAVTPPPSHSFIGHTQIPTLPSSLFVSLLASLPVGSNVDGLYTEIGGKLGENTFHNLPPNVITMLTSTTSNASSTPPDNMGKVLGEKLGHCFAVGGFNLPQNPKQIAKVIGFLASKVALKQSLEQANALLKDAGLGDDSGLHDIVAQLIGQAGPQIARRVVDCTISPSTEPTVPSSEFSGQKIISTLPTGHQYAALFRTIFIHLTQHFTSVGFHTMLPFMKEYFSLEDLEVAAKCFGGMLGNCVADRGWHTEKHTTWFTKEMSHVSQESEGSVVQAVSTQIDTQMAPFALSVSSKSSVHKLISDVTKTLGIPLFQRTIQCLFDDSLNVKGCDVPASAKAFNALRANGNDNDNDNNNYSYEESESEDMEPPVLSPFVDYESHGVNIPEKHRRNFAPRNPVDVEVDVDIIV